MTERKNVIIHDLKGNTATDIFGFLGNDYIVIDSNIKCAKCSGCFKCWLKTPGVCGFKDKLENVGQLILSSKKLVIISQMLYGGVSIPIKNVLDRSIPGITPFFKRRNGQLHHLQRYKSQTEIKAIFYNTYNISDLEKDQGREYIDAMGTNFYSRQNDIIFIDDTDFSGVSI